MIHGQLNLANSIIGDAYREAIARNIRENDGMLTRYFKEVIANMPPPPDPFWKEWQI